MGRIVGIDLGTTNSLVAYIDPATSAPKCIVGPSGSTLCPSVVSIDPDGSVIVGEPARRRLLTQPDRSIYSVKRLMGRGVADVLERLDLPEGSSWALLAEAETWVLVLDGHAAIGLVAASIGQAVFVAGGPTSIEVGVNGLTALVAYPATAPIGSLLQRLGESSVNTVSRRAAATAAPALMDLAQVRT